MKPLVLEPPSSELRRYWNDRARAFQPFSQAKTTEYYLEGEKRLFDTFFGDLKGKKVLKLDLWNEVHNTRVLFWAAGQGADVYAADISDVLTLQAGKNFRDEGRPGRFTVSDVRALPFQTGSFDCLYTMGTIEHMRDLSGAMAEIARVLAPGGIAVVGVPNKLDPFLRPMIVTIMRLFRIYPYGYEKSFTRGELRRLCLDAGLTPVGDGGVLFIPSLIRFADIFIYLRSPLLARPLGWLAAPFRWLSRRFPSLNKHGYLIACAGRKEE